MAGKEKPIQYIPYIFLVKDILGKK